MLRVRGIVAEVVDQIAPADVQHRADGDEGAEADQSRCRLQSSTAVQSAPLWLMNATLPGRAIARGEGGVQAGQRAHHAEAVRTDDAHASPGEPLPGSASRGAALLPDLFESCRDDDGAAYAGRRSPRRYPAPSAPASRSPPDRPGSGIPRSWIGLDPEHARPLRIDRERRFRRKDC